MFKPIHQLSAGFTLVEILVALLIVSVGLLGVATLQVRGQQFNQVAYFRTQATLLAYDLMERINITNTISNGAVSNGVVSYEEADFTDVGHGGKGRDDNCDNNSCLSEDLKNYDLNNWFNNVRETLPAGEARIVWEDNSKQYTITIRWRNIVDGKSDSWEEQAWTLLL
jgi:type IV pilus assembly protein PilV